MIVQNLKGCLDWQKSGGKAWCRTFYGSGFIKYLFLKLNAVLYAALYLLHELYFLKASNLTPDVDFI